MLIYFLRRIELYCNTTGPKEKTMQTALIIIAIVLIILLFIKLLTTPLRFIVKFIFNTLLGFAVLIIVNFLGSYIGISLGVNWINAVVIGLLGLPGVALLLVLQWLL